MLNLPAICFILSGRLFFYEDKCDLQSVLSVNVEDLALTTSVSLGQLSSHTECMGKLGFASPEFTEGFSDALAFNAPL